MDIQFDDPSCNGWIIIGPEQLKCGSAVNVHVAEVRIITDGSGKTKVTVNSTKSTICKEKLVDKVICQAIFHKDEAAKIRQTLCNLQNKGIETCGVCVSRFYADNPKEEE